MVRTGGGTVRNPSHHDAYITASLQPEIAQEVRDLLITTPTTDPYNRHKTELIRRTSISEQ